MPHSLSGFVFFESNHARDVASPGEMTPGASEYHRPGFRLGQHSSERIDQRLPDANVYGVTLLRPVD